VQQSKNENEKIREFEYSSASESESESESVCAQTLFKYFHNNCHIMFIRTYKFDKFRIPKASHQPVYDHCLELNGTFGTEGEG